MHRVTELRSPLEGFLPYFMGDLLRYLSARGTPEQPGPIPQRVLAALERLQAAKQDNGEPIVILTHSMGGQLMYDALSAFAPARPSLRDLQVDAWCASASQLGLFAGLGLFLTPTAPDGTLRVQDGPFADTKEQLGGTFVIEVGDLDDAIAWAAKAPSISWGTVEIRPTATRFVDGAWTPFAS